MWSWRLRGLRVEKQLRMGSLRVGRSRRRAGRRLVAGRVEFPSDVYVHKLIQTVVDLRQRVPTHRSEPLD
jgi:hypothetical protein